MGVSTYEMIASNDLLKRFKVAIMLFMRDYPDFKMKKVKDRKYPYFFIKRLNNTRVYFREAPHLSQSQLEIYCQGKPGSVLASFFEDT